MSPDTKEKNFSQIELPPRTISTPFLLHTLILGGGKYIVVKKYGYFAGAALE